MASITDDFKATMTDRLRELQRSGDEFRACGGSHNRNVFMAAQTNWKASVNRAKMLLQVPDDMTQPSDDARNRLDGLLDEVHAGLCK